MTTRFRITLAIMLATALPALAQNFPAKPVRVIIAFPPGSATDIIGRVITQKVGEQWGQNVLADNRGGAGGSIASAIAAKSAPDGYTLIINSLAHAVNPSMFAKLPYDTARDFDDIMPLVGQPTVLVVRSDSRFASINAFIAEGKSHFGKITFAFAGLGSGTHLGLEKLKLSSRIDVTAVSYKGSGEVIVDVMGGRVDTYLAPISAAMSYIRGNRLRALAVTTKKRTSQLPDTPTMVEAGLPGFDFSIWFGLWAPAGVPAPIVSKISSDFTRAIDDPGVRDKLVALGNEPISMKPQEFRKFVRQEIGEYARMFKAAGIKPQ
ncbi:MAG: tripartite tricarboxylate transporter substrate-binding protein [Betaproteobacteria bacterium]|nr:tripartite tricarboxylate transporter substrate-binding protein [Betaproteobacteria bacterium]